VVEALVSLVLHSEGGEVVDYILDRSWGPERTRLTLQAHYLDPLTIDHLERIGIAEGWRCLELGAGTGSIALCLSERVGPSGSVVAADLDTSLLAGHGRDNLEVLELDVLTDDLPRDFDLVHFRLLVGHLDDPFDGLKRIYGTVKPGGWMLAEESDSLWALVDGAPAWPPDPDGGKIGRALVTLWNEIGFDPWWGRNLLESMSALGMSDIEGEVRSPLLTGEHTRVAPLSVARFRQQLISRGDLTEEEFDRYEGRFSEPDMRTFLFFLTSVWGRRPSV
jgi:SAM-dependent methyltransferase